MKRIIVFCLALLLAVGTPFFLLPHAVCLEKERVGITETVLFGERSAADGLTVERLFGYDEHLFWHTVYRAGETASYETDYSFYPSEHYGDGVATYHGFSMDEYISIGADLNRPAEEQSGMARVFKELYDKTPVGTTTEESVYLKDVYEYYPLEFNISLPNVSFRGINYEDLRDPFDKNEKYVIDTFRDFFKIPVSDTAGYKLHISVSGKNNVSSGAVTFGDFYVPRCESAYTASTCFFSIPPVTNSGKKADLSLVPGGYGIYAFRYSFPKEPLETGVDADSLKMVYPLPDDETVFSLYVDEAEKTLFILTDGEKGARFYAVDIATMETLDTVTLAEERLVYTEACGDFFFLELQDNRAAVIEKKEDGYRHAYTVSISHVGEKLFDSFCAKAFDGERLALVSELYREESTYLPLCGFTLAVYDKTGLLFHAEYLTDIEPNLLHAHREMNCLPAEARATAFWERKE